MTINTIITVVHLLIRTHLLKDKAMDLQMSQYYRHLQSHACNYAAEIVHISFVLVEDHVTASPLCHKLYHMGANSEPQRALYFISTAVVSEYSCPTPRMH